MKSVLFTNWSDAKFTWTWDNVPFDFEAGQTVYLQDYLANHFAKHLTDRELLRANKMTNDPARGEFLSRCFKSEVVEAKSEESLKAIMLNKNAELEDKIAPKQEIKKPFCDSCDSKGVRHKADCPKTKPVQSDEDSFAGLK